MTAERISTEKTLKNVSLTLHEGEILGIGGLTESGMHDLGRVLYGIETPIGGAVTLSNGHRVKNPWESVDQKIGYVSKNRDVEALLLTASIQDNITLASLRRISRKSLVSSKIEEQMANEQVESLNIKCSHIGQIVNHLSGGNKQKVVFGKWIASGADILILDCPTRGVDIGVKSAMYRLMYELKKQGKSIVMISEELPELIGMSDRILIMKDGTFTGEFTTIIGNNGCGKSTLLKTIAGILPVTRGEIQINGDSALGLTAAQHGKLTAYLPQGKNTPDITAGRMVLHGRFPYLSYPRKYKKEDYDIALNNPVVAGMMNKQFCAFQCHRCVPHGPKTVGMGKELCFEYGF